MALYLINSESENIKLLSDDIDDKSLMTCEVIDELAKKIEPFSVEKSLLEKCDYLDVIDFLDDFSRKISTSGNVFQKEFESLGISFLIYFLRKQNLMNLLKVSLKGNANYLREFTFNPDLEKHLLACPQGVIVHWLAGNVPMLGMLSLIQGMITGNTNVIKLPRKNGYVLPKMLHHMRQHEFITASGRVISGAQILKHTMMVYCSRDDRKGQDALSAVADVRIAWGGHEAVESVMQSVKNHWTDDLVFGPKYSMVVIGKDSFKEEQLEDIVYKIALDASVFEQQGCNSPQIVYVEEGSSVSSRDFARSLGKAMEKMLTRIPKQPISDSVASKILSVRAEYDLTGETYCSEGIEWSVLYSESGERPDFPHFRTLFVRPIKQIDDALDEITHSCQTMGLSVKEDLRLEFAKKASVKGIDRITDLGKMSVYDHPWDGLFPLERLIRWVSLY